MSKQLLAEVKGKVTSTWVSEHRLVLDEWQNFFVGLAEFRKAIFETSLPAAVRLGVRAWIVDSRNAKGVLSDEVQEFIAKVGHKTFAAQGIQHFITIRATSATANLSIQRFERVVGPSGMKLVTVDSVEDAVEYLANVDAGKIAA